MVGSLGRLWVYKQLVKVFANIDSQDGLTIADVHLIGTSDPLFQILGSVFSVENAEVSVKNCNVNGFIFDAFIYQWTKQPLSPVDVRKLERSFTKKVKELSG